MSFFGVAAPFLLSSHALSFSSGVYKGLLFYWHININISVDKKEYMNKKYTSKVQRHGGSRLVSIPKTIRDVFNIDTGDSLEWELDPTTNTVTVRKAK